MPLVCIWWRDFRRVYRHPAFGCFALQDTLAAMMEDAQFAHVGYEDILDGVVSIHSGFKYQ